jgi:hypothetical protein
MISPVESIVNVVLFLFLFDRLEEECDSFSGSTDEETALLEKIKFQHELLDTERKVSICRLIR